MTKSGRETRLSIAVGWPVIIGAVILAMRPGHPGSLMAQSQPTLPQTQESSPPPATSAPTTSTAPASRPVTLIELLSAAVRSAQDNRFKRAEQWFRRVLIDHPTRRDANLGLARVLMEQEQYVAARITLEAFVKTPEGLTSEQAYLMLGRLYLESGLARQALFNLLKAYDLNPTDAEIRASLAVTYKDLGDHENELEFARLAAQIEPDSIDYGTILVGALLANGLQDEADLAARHALAITLEKYREKPDDFNRLQALESQTNFVIRVLLGHLQSEPVRVDLLLELADLTDSYSVIQQSTRNYNAMRYVMQAEKLRPNDPKIILRKAGYERKVLRLKDAFNSYTKVLELDPNNEEALKWTAKIRQIVPALQKTVQSDERAEATP